MTTTPAIAEKWQQLYDKGLDLGDKLGLEQDAGFDGRFQIYRNGRIYWHEQLGTFEVHGRRLDKYIEFGGSGTNPKTGLRELGLPTTDESRSDDGLYPAG